MLCSTRESSFNFRSGGEGRSQDILCFKTGNLRIPLENILGLAVVCCACDLILNFLLCCVWLNQCVNFGLDLLQAEHLNQ